MFKPKVELQWTTRSISQTAQADNLSFKLQLRDSESEISSRLEGSNQKHR